MKEAILYRYRITGYYWHGDCGIEVKDRFEEIVYAVDEIVAMQQVLGKLAWHCSLEDETFRMEFIHYDVW